LIKESSPTGPADKPFYVTGVGNVLFAPRNFNANQNSFCFLLLKILNKNTSLLAFLVKQKNYKPLKRIPI
jgi:hypothetical protein